jgi:sigma-B regulation protein RsbU (phosphoserine phosphatase)
VQYRSRSRLGRSAPSLGLLVDWLEDRYQSAIVAGARSAAGSFGANLLVFAGGILGATARSTPQRNRVFELANPDNLDGLMVLGGVGNHLGAAALARYCERYRPLPMCSIAMALEGMPSVLVDNDSGMEDAISHLVRVHGHRKIAFVRGPTSSVDAERRYGVYLTVLAANGIALDERLVVIGDFETGSGADAVRTLLDERGISASEIQAIVASNDSMALGVLSALNARRIRVPGEIALIGFDDVEDARVAQPPFTTVRQPLEEQGRQAVRLLMSELRDGRRPADVVLKTELMIRRSCGCNGAGERRTHRNDARFGFEASLVERRQSILAELTRASRGEFGAAGSAWEARLVSAFASELRGEQARAFGEAAEAIVERVLEHGVDASICDDVLSALRFQLLACLAKEPGRLAQAEDLFQEVRLASANIVQRRLGRERAHLARWARSLSRVGASLVGAFDMPALIQTLVQRFPELDIRSCFVIAFVGPLVPSPTARVVLAYDNQRRSPAVDAVFPTRRLVPPELEADGQRPRALVVSLIFFREEVLGYMLIEIEESDLFAHESLRDLMSSALKGARLAERLSEVERESEGCRAALAAATESRAALETRLAELGRELGKLASGEDAREALLAQLAELAARIQGRD